MKKKISKIICIIIITVLTISFCNINVYATNWEDKVIEDEADDKSNIMRQIIDMTIEVVNPFFNPGSNDVEYLQDYGKKYSIDEIIAKIKVNKEDDIQSQSEGFLLGKKSDIIDLKNKTKSLMTDSKYSETWNKMSQKAKNRYIGIYNACDALTRKINEIESRENFDEDKVDYGGISNSQPTSFIKAKNYLVKISSGTTATNFNPGGKFSTDEGIEEYSSKVRQKLLSKIKSDLQRYLEEANTHTTAVQGTTNSNYEQFEEKKALLLKQLQAAKTVINDLMEDAEEEYTSEVNNDIETLYDREGSLTPPTLGQIEPDQKTSPDEIIEEASNFLNTGKNNQGSILVNGDNVTKASNMLFNVLFTIAVSASILIGIYLGIKFMMSSAEDKASIKESLLPYFIGVIIMFSSFSIWKLVLVLLQSIE